MTKQTSPKDKAGRTVVRRHPFRGAFWGLVFGSGIALHLLGFGLVAFGAWPLLAAPVVGAMVLGLAWGMVGPARKVKGWLPPERRQVATSNERRSPAEVRASQILASRQANEELHDIAMANEDGAMSAALHEAEKDAVKVASPAARQLKAKSTRDTSSQQAPRTRHAERLEPVAATPAELFTAAEPSVADAPIPAPAHLPEPMPSPPLSLATPADETPTATPVPPLPDNPPSELIVEATAEPMAQIAAEPVAEIAAPTVTIAQDLTPFENSPLPNGADEEQLAAEKLDAQLDAALREAVAVTTRNG